MTSYTRRQLYAVISDVDSYASFVPFCTRSRIIRPLAPTPTPATPNAQQMEAELTVAFLAFTERYTSRVTCVPYESVKVRIPFSIFGKIVFVFRVVSIPILIGCFSRLGCRCRPWVGCRGIGYATVQEPRDDVAFSSCFNNAPGQRSSYWTAVSGVGRCRPDTRLVRPLIRVCEPGSRRGL